MALMAIDGDKPGGGGQDKFRIRFALDDNNNAVNDYIGYYSGGNSTAANRPRLVVTYQ